MPKQSKDILNHNSASSASNSYIRVRNEFNSEVDEKDSDKPRDSVVGLAMMSSVLHLRLPSFLLSLTLPLLSPRQLPSFVFR